jgi:hypothetical protein
MDKYQMSLQKTVLIGVLMYVLLLFPCAVSAQVAPGGGGGGNGAGDSVVSSGTLVGAAFETMGYTAQAQVLDDMSEHIEELAGLIYLGVLFSAILTAGLMGYYPPALWLLVGPPMFIYTSGVSINGADNRTDARAPEWRFGAFEDNGLKDELTRGNVGNANVSFVFHKYNEIISEIYQKLISEITSEDISNQMLFMTRQRMIEELFGMQIQTPSTRALVGYMLFMCPTELSYAQKTAALKRTPSLQDQPGYAGVEDKYCDLFPKKNKRLPNNQLGKYVKESLEVEYEDGELVSCLDLWNWSRMGLHKDIAGSGEQAINQVFGPEVVRLAQGADIINRVLRDILAKLNVSSDGETTQTADQCPFEDPPTQGVMGSDEFRTLVNIFSGLLIRKTQTSGRNETALQQIYAGNFSGIRPSDDSLGRRITSGSQREEQMRRDRAQELSVANQFEAFHMVMLLPYLQAILLYMLSVMYPFFALLIIVPGQASNFFTWMALWAWVKSWDVGWAIVMVTDNLLWEIMPHGTFVNGQTDNFSPTTLMEMHFDGDYAYSSTFYWVILAALIGAVPVVTAQAILGSKRAIAGAVTRGITDIASRLTTPAQNYVRTGNVHGVVTPRERGEVHNFNQNTGDSEAGLNNVSQDIGNTVQTLGQQLGDTPGKSNMSKGDGVVSGNNAAETQALNDKSDN